jgi:hypothetical protein
MPYKVLITDVTNGLHELVGNFTTYPDRATAAANAIAQVRAAKAAGRWCLATIHELGDTGQAINWSGLNLQTMTFNPPKAVKITR